MPVPEVFVVNSRGERTPFARRHLLGSLIDAGVPVELASPRAARVADAVATLGVTEVSTDNLRRALDVVSEGGSALELGAVLRTPVRGLSLPEVPFEEFPSAAISAEPTSAGRVAVAYVAPVRKGHRAVVRRDDGAEVWSSAITSPAAFDVLDRGALAEGRVHHFEILDAGGQVLATSMLPPTFWPQLAPEPTDEDVQRTIDEINRLIEEHESLAEAIKWLPLWRLSRILRALARFVELLQSLDVRQAIAFGKWLACSSEALAEFSTEELRQLLEVLLAQLRLELDSVEPDSPERAGLEAAIARLEAELRDWDPAWAADKAREVLGAFKVFLLAELPGLLALLAGHWREFVDELEQLGPMARRMALSTLAKYLLKKLILRILAKRLGDEAAKRLVPWVGLALTAVEVLAILALVDKLDNLVKAIDQRVADLMLALAAAGVGWPSQTTYVWINKRYRHGWVRICAFKRCARRRPDGCVRWSPACPLDFDDGKHCKLVPLNAQTFDPVTGQFVIPYQIDPASADAPCGDASSDPEIVCYTYLRVTLWWLENGKVRHLESNLVVGAKAP